MQIKVYSDGKAYIPKSVMQALAVNENCTFIILPISKNTFMLAKEGTIAAGMANQVNIEIQALSHANDFLGLEIGAKIKPAVGGKVWRRLPGAMPDID
jgi:hypothetical protein